ncbi:hypothetical protein FANTH_11028 [Fusarium anthophilum]|uniref:Uncharacterized protein n=1 Tax=Fusarium anthophilum TaxID=48485 RepID=A0A8H4YZF4_9HYPO|nr:hypothetical protein FANTH_11028 [Fusarium anthophilum]
MIWGFSASTGDSNGLLRCCRQTRDEFSHYCQLSDNVDELHKLKILVDSTYDHGIWPKFDHYRKQNGHIRHAVSAIQDMSDPMVLRLGKMRNIDDIVVVLPAPRRGHFVGAFMMMFAKMDDVYAYICNRSRFRRNKGWPSDAKITISFTTEGIQSGQSTREAKNFWECRATKILEDHLKLPLGSYSSSLWLEHYPNGIRYHWNGRSLVEWNFRWEAKKHQIRKRTYYREDRVARLSRWWECLGCCQGSLHCVSELASPCDQKRLRNTYAFIQDYDSDDPYDQLQSEDTRIGRPVMISRECIRTLKLKKGNSWVGGWCTYRTLASEYTIWNTKSRSRETTAEKRDFKFICCAYSVEALCNDRVTP